MFGKFAEFWIKNGKLTFVMMLLVFCWGVMSWLILPKQYNPDIVVPAFNVVVPSPGFTSKEVNNLIVTPLENKLMEMEDVDHVYGISDDDYGAVMVTFEVGTDKEDATTRLYNKIDSNMDMIPIGVHEPIIKPMDPDDIPVYTFAIYFEGTGTNQTDLTLRKIGNDLINQLKLVDGSSVFYFVGGDKESINIKLDYKLLESKNIDVMQVYDILSNNNISMPGGDFDVGQTNNKISIDGNLNDIQAVKKLMISNYNGSPVYLEDVAIIYKGISEHKYSNLVGLGNGLKNAIYIGVAKKKGVNAVYFVDDLKEKLQSVSKEFPDGYSIMEVQNEGQSAKDATNILIVNLFQSITIVFLVLLFYLGFKDALNNSIAIPLTLAITFGISLALGDNVNRITLFALILVLGMLVDNSTVIVENIARHLSDRINTGKDKLTAILDGVNEVGTGIMYATITRILAFVAMFFVTGMMGQYMGPIPKYAIIALTTSLLIAFSVNPFLAYLTAKDTEKLKQSNKDKSGNNNSKKSKLSIDNIYKGFMSIFITPKRKRPRSIFKITFWILLFAVIITPPAMLIFKARMLPKSDQNQVYLWINAENNSNLDKTEQIAEGINNYLNKYYKNNGKSELAIISDVSYWIGNPPVPDFSNMFRGSSSRNGKNQISMRINLIDNDFRDITSENFVIKIRPLLREYLSSNFPGTKVRLLEDPPGPPVRATFMLEVQGKPDSNYNNLIEITHWLREKINPILVSNKVRDVYTTDQSYSTDYEIVLNHEMISTLGLNAKQISYSIYNLVEGSEISLLHTEKTKEPLNIYLSMKEEQRDNLQLFDNLSFTNNQGKKVFLRDISEIVPVQKDQILYSDDAVPTVYIYGEMGDDSVVYPVVNLFNVFNDTDFWEGKFEVESYNPYGFKIVENATGETYYVNFGGEWELTMDTFRDLGLAMIIAIGAIYFLLVAQFKSFGVGGVIMITFLLGFLGVMPGFSLLYIMNNEYFSATSMIGVIALAGIVVGNAIILIDYMNVLLKKGYDKANALLEAGATRLRPIIITSLTTVLGATTILGDPVWSGLAWAIIWGLSVSAVLTLVVIPVFMYKGEKN